MSSNSMMYTVDEFKNMVVVVTGAAQGIGAQVAKQLAELGANVARLDRDFPKKTSAESAADNVKDYCVDVCDREAVLATIAQLENQLGPIDFLVSCAGILRVGKLLKTTEKDWLDTFAVNTHGVFNICQTVASRMAERKRGSIVIVSSNAATTPRTNMGAYPASKAASSQFARCLALELAPFQVRCNIVSPGSTDTAMQRQCWQAEADAQSVIRGSLENYRLGIPLTKIATPKDIANTVIYLLSSAASHITMENITVDGGATLGVG